MAKKKMDECDWKGCRKRKGVEWYSIEMFSYAADEADDNSHYKQGNLCPVHRQVMIDRLAFEDIT